MDGNDLHLKREDLQSPLVSKLSDMAYELAKVRFMIVFPRDDGWGQIESGDGTRISSFCRMIHSTDEGGRHCRMCHILMSIAACNSGPTAQTCHSGATVLVAPVHQEGRPCFALLSSCVFAKEGDSHAESEVREKACKLGLDPDEMAEAFNALPRLDDDKSKLLLSLMEAIGMAICEAHAHKEAEALMTDAQGAGKARHEVRTAVEHELKGAFPLPRSTPKTLAHSPDKGLPPLIDVVSSLVARKPNMPFSVTEIAAAARITPNHFSTLFHQHVGQSFSAFLTGKRVERAKELLSHLTLNITEVAAMSGYDDPGYFARVFKRSTGLSPREWRQSLERAP